MQLILTVTSYQKSTLGPQQSCTFGEEGGSIGRSRSCDWVLPDPDKYLSSRHASIAMRGDGFQITDTSTNGIFVNGARQPVGRGRSQALEDGDVLVMGEFEIAVHVEGASDAGFAPPQQTPLLHGSDDLLGETSDEVDPLSLIPAQKVPGMSGSSSGGGGDPLAGIGETPRGDRQEPNLIPRGLDESDDEGLDDHDLLATHPGKAKGSSIPDDWDPKSAPGGIPADDWAPMMATPGQSPSMSPGGAPASSPARSPAASVPDDFLGPLGEQAEKAAAAAPSPDPFLPMEREDFETLPDDLADQQLPDRKAPSPSPMPTPTPSPTQAPAETAAPAPVKTSGAEASIPDDFFDDLAPSVPTEIPSEPVPPAAHISSPADSSPADSSPAAPEPSPTVPVPPELPAAPRPQERASAALAPEIPEPQAVPVGSGGTVGDDGAATGIPALPDDFLDDLMSGPAETEVQSAPARPAAPPSSVPPSPGASAIPDDFLEGIGEPEASASVTADDAGDAEIPDDFLTAPAAPPLPDGSPPPAQETAPPPATVPSTPSEEPPVPSAAIPDDMLPDDLLEPPAKAERTSPAAEASPAPDLPLPDDDLTVAPKAAESPPLPGDDLTLPPKSTAMPGDDLAMPPMRSPAESVPDDDLTITSSRDPLETSAGAPLPDDLLPPEAGRTPSRDAAPTEALVTVEPGMAGLDPVVSRGRKAESASPPAMPVLPPTAALTEVPQAVATQSNPAATAGPVPGGNGAAAFWHALGVTPAAGTMDEAALADAGAALRAAADGLVGLLNARRALKDQFRMAQTRVEPVANNALKFAADGEEALNRMVGQSDRGYIPLSRAIKEGFADIQAHEMATLHGMQEALTAVLRRFDPKILEQRFQSRGRGGLFSSGSKSRYWELYQTAYQEIVGDASDSFDELFGEAFSKAYDARMAQLNRGGDGR